MGTEESAPAKNARAPKDARAVIRPHVRRILLDRVEQYRVNPRLQHVLRAVVRIQPRLTEATGVVAPESAETCFETTAGGRLLILGEAGVGKTNLLMELAEKLIAEARLDPAARVPVVFSLPRWALFPRERSLGEWMVDDLAAEYGVSRANARALEAQKLILPLLDGLDEVAAERREACLRVIRFRAKRTCARILAHHERSTQ